MTVLLKQRSPWKRSKERGPSHRFPVSMGCIRTRFGNGESIFSLNFPLFSRIRDRKLIKSAKSWKTNCIGKSAGLKSSWSGLKKNLSCSVEEKRALIESEHGMIPIDRQCALLGISRSAYYYQPVEIDLLDLALMKQIDEQYTRTPFYGVLRMTACLRRGGYR